LRGAMNRPMSTVLSGVRCMTTGSAVSGMSVLVAMSIVASIMTRIVNGITMVSIVRRQNEFDYKASPGPAKT